MKAADFLWSYRCNLKGCCCSGWRVGFREHDWHRMKRAAAGTALEPLVDEATTLKRRTRTPFAALIPPRAHVGRFDQHFGEMAKGDDGACLFLAEDKSCKVHAEVGEAAMPQICRNFPVSALHTPDGVDTFWETICPEVTATLADADEPAAVVGPPEDFDRPVLAFRPNAGAPPVRLTWRREVPWEALAAFREDAAALLAAAPGAPLRSFARLLWYVHEWASRGEMEHRLRDYSLSEGAYVTGLLQVAAAFRETANSPRWIRRRLGSVRRFFQHHPWGTEGTLDLLERAELPSGEQAAEALAEAGPDEHLVLTNYLVARSQAVPLHNNGTLLSGWLNLAEGVGSALYFAGVFARAAGGPPGKGPMASAVALSEWMYRGRSDQPKPFAANRRVGVVALGDPPGSFGDLPPVLSRLSERRGVPLRFDDGDEALDALAAALTSRLEVALEAHAREVKATLSAPLDRLGLPSIDPWSGEPPAAVAPLVEHARRAERSLADRLSVTGDDVPLAALARRLGLGAEELALLGILHLVDTDVAWARALVHVGVDYSHRLPSTRTFAALLGSGGLGALADDGPLRRLEVVVEETPRGAAPGDGDRRWALATRVQSFLLGAPDAPPAELAPHLAREGAAATLCRPPASLVERVREARREVGDGPGLVALVGPEGHDRIALVRAATERPVVGVHVTAAGIPERTLRLAAREARLTDAALVLLLDPRALDDSGCCGALLEVARLAGRPVFLSTRRSPSPLFGSLPIALVDAPSPTWEERLRLLVRALPPGVVLGDPDGLRATVRSLAIPPDQLLAATRHATTDALLSQLTDDDGGRPRLSVGALTRAMREQMTSRLGEYAHLVAVSQSWEDLQLPDQDKARLDELVTAHRHRHTVLEDWGFGADASGNGLTALFYGPPGTGKTMAAGIVARELGLEIFRLDLSRVVDKYIGETEKALARVFDEAEQGEVLLLFDEADSLFGKRTGVSSSTDRYANLGVNYLLQRIERYRGVVVLTTNHASHMDDAFKRRIRYRIHFPVPDVEQRIRIWQSLLPDEAPVDLDDVDWEWLGEDFELTGGHIRNAVLTAATLAAIRERPIGMDELVEGANREYRSLGRVVRTP